MELQGKTLAITGVGGFIGLRMAERAQEAGMKVRGLELSEKAAAKARDAGAEVVAGNVTDLEAARNVCRGADVVFHTAAIVKEGGSLEEFRKVNVEGARLVAKAAKEAGAKYFVHLSSVMVYGFDFPDGITEEGPFRGENNPYCQTKIESEQAVMSFHDPGTFDVIVIRPGDVYGPGSIPWVVRPLEMMKRRQFPLMDKGKGLLNHTYVDNLIDGIFLALEKEATGQAFNIAEGKAATFNDFYGRLAGMAGLGKLSSVPVSAMKPIAWALEKAFSAIGREPPISPQAIGFVMRPGVYSIERARKILGYEPKVTLEEGLEKTEAWLRQEGLIK